MTPQRNEKAKDEAYRIFLRFYGDVTYGTSKQCAKVVVKEIIEFSENGCMLCKQSKREFYQEVLKEIDNL